MTAPPLPERSCMRVRLGYANAAGTELGSRFYLAYSGSAPTAANCLTLAGDVAAAWQSNIAGAISSQYTLTEVDVLDITTDSGAFGTVTTSHQGGDSSTLVTANAAINVEFDIARRYRGGKPRMFLPPAGSGSLLSADKWTTGLVSTINTDFANFISEIAALSIGAIGTLSHVNVSYYQSFQNVTNSSGRTRAAPKYKTVATLDNITGYSCKQVVGSQRRRRTATTQ